MQFLEWTIVWAGVTDHIFYNPASTFRQHAPSDAACTAGPLAIR